VVEAALLTRGWKLVYCSTYGVPGNLDRPPGNEDAPINPPDCCQRTKYDWEPLAE
jgi:hypothetical protein